MDIWVFLGRNCEVGFVIVLCPRVNKVMENFVVALRFLPQWVWPGLSGLPDPPALPHFCEACLVKPIASACSLSYPISRGQTFFLRQAGLLSRICSCRGPAPHKSCRGLAPHFEQSSVPLLSLRLLPGPPHSPTQVPPLLLEVFPIHFSSAPFSGLNIHLTGWPSNTCAFTHLHSLQSPGGAGGPGREGSDP